MFGIDDEGCNWDNEHNDDLDDDEDDISIKSMVIEMMIMKKSIMRMRRFLGYTGTGQSEASKLIKSLPQTLVTVY